MNDDATFKRILKYPKGIFYIFANNNISNSETATFYMLSNNNSNNTLFRFRVVKTKSITGKVTVAALKL